jgi:hypothetical protein
MSGHNVTTTTALCSASAESGKSAEHLLLKATSLAEQQPFSAGGLQQNGANWKIQEAGAKGETVFSFTVQVHE